jgi:hypothetical protein
VRLLPLGCCRIADKSENDVGRDAVIIFAAATAIGCSLTDRGRPFESWDGDVVAVYPDGSESFVENNSTIRSGDRWGTSSYVIDRLERRPGSSAAGDLVRAILVLAGSADAA